ncbi:MAG TPA: branched-chain amino acid transaminase [Polyangiaceae bacterium]|jgi:branched-chain amino acid aminotransferase|nr:branched-chain amino acid transaminase [Polyangiaceae bacterium]
MTALDKEWPSFDHMPDDDQLTASRPRGQKLARWVWWDGEVREADQLSVHYYSNALHYGTAVFEGIRCYPTSVGPVLVRLRDHIDRLLSSARLYGMKVPFDAETMIRGAIDVTRRNGIQNGYLRPLAYFGAGPIDLKPKRECPVRVFIAVRELGTFLGEDALRNGIRVMISSWRKFHHTMLPTMAKASGHYANSVLAAHEAFDQGFEDAILLNQDGTVASATGQNVFFVKSGTLFTNDESSSIVPGITRDCILNIASEHKIPIVIRAFTREDLLRADEVFLTGTAAEVTPVRELGGVRYTTGKTTLSAFFQRAYLQAVTGKDDSRRDWLTAVLG